MKEQRPAKLDKVENNNPPKQKSDVSYSRSLSSDSSEKSVFRQMSPEEILAIKLANGIRIKGSNNFTWSKTLERSEMVDYLFGKKGTERQDTLGAPKKVWFESVVGGPLVPIR